MSGYSTALIEINSYLKRRIEEYKVLKEKISKLFDNKEYNQYMSGFDMIVYEILGELDIVYERKCEILDELEKRSIEKKSYIFLQLKSRKILELRKNLVEHFGKMVENMRINLGKSPYSDYYELDEITAQLKEQMLDVEGFLIDLNKINEDYLNIEFDKVSEVKNDSSLGIIQLNQNLSYNRETNIFQIGKDKISSINGYSNWVGFMELILENGGKVVSYSEVGDKLGIKASVGKTRHQNILQVKDSLFRKLRDDLGAKTIDINFILTKKGYLIKDILTSK